MLTTIGFTLIAIGVLQCAVNKKAGLYFDGRRSLNSPTRQNLLGVGILSIITGVALFFL